MRQAVLLAAGAGRRLMPRTRETPKCLLPVAGRPIVDHLLAALAPLELEELLVVTGWQAERLRAHLGEARGRLRIRYLHNPHHATSNNVVSLHHAAPAIAPPFALLESDVLAEPAVLAPLRQPDCLVISRWVAGMRGTAVRLDGGGWVRAVVLAAHRDPGCGRQRRPMLKTVNLSSFSAETWSRLRPALARCVAEGRTDLYYEAPLADLVASGDVRLRGFDASALRWHEVDDEGDLRRAWRLFQGAPERRQPPRRWGGAPTTGGASRRQSRWKSDGPRARGDREEA